MENNEKKKLTKGQIAIIVLLVALVASYVAIAILDVFNVIPDIRWASHLCACLVWLAIGCVSWTKYKGQAALDFVASAIFGVLFVMELVEVLA